METLFGSLVVAIPLLLVGYFLFWRNYRPVFWMLAGALIVGLGYLGFVGATDELGKPIVEAIHSYQGTASHSMSSSTNSGTSAPAPAAMKSDNAASSTEGASTSGSPSDGRYVTP